jgi:predicted acetyltransferase
MKPEIEYLPDDSVYEALDQEIRDLLTSCFAKPQDVVFKDRRYFCEPYPHRWVIRDDQGVMVAHIGVHEKSVVSQGRSFRIGGIAEVCVHPDHRGRGYVRMMLLCINEWLTQHNFDFSVLFGNPLIYGSSGYVQVDNVFHGTEPQKDGTKVKPLVKQLSREVWSEADVYLFGPKF